MSKLAIITFTLLFSSISFSALSNEIEYLTTPTGGDFSIPTYTDKSFRLSNLKGKITFLFFGFTKCPNICPMTTQRLKMLSNYLEKNNLQDAHFLFISVDNERDTLATLDQYAKSKGKLFSATTASDDKLREIIAQYGGYYSRIKTPSNKLIVDHSSNVYVIDPNGKWIDTIQYNKPFTDYLAAYKKAKENIVSLPTSSVRREMNNLGQNAKCDLGKKTCEFTLDDNKIVKLTFSPYPIKTQKEFKVTLTSDSKKYTPVEIDFVGVEQNMGLIRPSFKNNGNANYQATLELPLCERSQMRWKVRLILKDELSQLHFIEFFLETID